MEESTVPVNERRFSNPAKDSAPSCIQSSGGKRWAFPASPEDAEFDGCVNEDQGCED